MLQRYNEVKVQMHIEYNLDANSSDKLLVDDRIPK